MYISGFKFYQRQEIISLFNNVFSDSEGEKEGQLIATLVSELIENTPSGDLLGFIAQEDSKIIAASFLSRFVLSTGERAMILSPLAVDTKNQRKGVGQELIRFSIQFLKENNIDFLFTYGDPKYYSKLGFQAINEACVQAPLNLSFPFGWLAQSLQSKTLDSLKASSSQCVEALNKQIYW